MLKNSLCIPLSLFNTRISFHLVGCLPWKWSYHWSESCSVLSDSLWPHGLYSPWNSPGQNTRVDSLSLLQWILQTQELNWGLWHCRWILYQLSYQGSPWTWSIVILQVSRYEFIHSDPSFSSCFLVWMIVWKVTGGTVWQDLMFTWEGPKPRKVSLLWTLSPKLNCIFLWTLSLPRLRESKSGAGVVAISGSHSLRICIWHKCESLLPKTSLLGINLSQKPRSLGVREGRLAWANFACGELSRVLTL